MALEDPRYADNALTVNSTSIEVEKGSVSLGNEHLEELPESGDKFQPDSVIITSIRNFIDFTLYQPVFSSPALLTNCKFNWKLYDAHGVSPSAGLTRVLSKSTIVPISINAEKGQLAKFQKRAYSLFSSGNSITSSTGIDTPAVVTSPYKLDSVEIGETAIKSVRSVSVNYNHEVEWPPELQPEEIWIKRSATSGSIVLDDLSEATLDRLKTVDVDDIDIVFINESDTTSTVSFTNCAIKASISGSQLTLDWQKITD